MKPTPTSDFIRCDIGQLVEQIGRFNIVATSGGLVEQRETGVTLHVGNGYSVDVDLTFLDLYTVQRIYTKNGHRFVKGVERNIYNDQVGDSVYRAGRYLEPFGH